MDTYNGWKNYPTWNIALWIENDYGTYQYWQERSIELLEETDGDLSEAEFKLSKELEDSIESEINDNVSNSGYISDIITWAISQIDWFEIAEHIAES